jgi:2-dehydro-3-deoxyphosphooctonate aldolase (KDO 8-P synthase)
VQRHFAKFGGAAAQVKSSIPDRGFVKSRMTMERSEGADIIEIGRDSRLIAICGPCVIENEALTRRIASELKRLSVELNLPIIFKASYDKANRTSIDSFRGPGVKAGLDILKAVKTDFHIPITSDVHTVGEMAAAADILDMIQIPAFLCRQTDLLIAAGETGKPVNIKKGQFLAPWDIKQVVKKIESTGNRLIWITERGTMFGYNNLVVDFRGIPIMKDLGYPVIFDATHSIQLPGGGGNRSGGQREFAPTLAKAAVAAGADGVFMEVHPNPEKALCDGPNSLALADLRELLMKLIAIKQAA